MVASGLSLLNFIITSPQSDPSIFNLRPETKEPVPKARSLNPLCENISLISCFDGSAGIFVIVKPCTIDLPSSKEYINFFTTWGCSPFACVHLHGNDTLIFNPNDLPLPSVM